jgi:hypothetical protein
MKTKILFSSPASGTIEVKNGKLVSGKTFENVNKVIIETADEKTSRGAYPTIIGIMSQENPFSFNLRDVNSNTPIYIPEFGAAVVPADDQRDFQEIADFVAAKKLEDDFARFENEDEETFENAAKYNRKQYSHTWLGLGRDMRMFRVGYQDIDAVDRRFDYWGQIQPCYHTIPQSMPEQEDSFYQLFFEIGQGASCRPRITRRLEDGVLPILRSVQYEQDINYHITAFATLEKEPLSQDNVRGSEWEACYPNTGGCMLSDEQKDEIKDLLEKEMRQREQEVVCCMRVEAVNIGKVPRYAWFKSPSYGTFKREAHKLKDSGAFEDGLTFLQESGKVLAISQLDSDMLPDEEMAVLIQPGKKAVFEILIPHSPVSKERAEQLKALDFDEHLDACRKFWHTKLESAAKISVPEKHIDESIKAGLLHCDLVTLGKEPDGPALATIGWYSPIGTESAPIIQFYDSMGWHKLAERSIQFFFERQFDNGFIQNFNRYESETGPLLWTVGEHFRYTQDAEWLKRVMPNIKRAVNYLLEWRERNKKEELKAQGCYGMVDGKVADPDDYYHSFFLNAGTYIGLKRIAQVCRDIEPDFALPLAEEVKAYQQDIINGFYYSQAKAPLMPTGDGSWAPLMPPWTEYTGGISFYADGGKWFSHGAFASRSCLTGPLWLTIGEVLEPDEIGTDFMIKTNQYPVSLENAALSQPYYCRHDFSHVQRREVKPFLKTYYNQLSGIQDHETYTFWEHYYHASEHKTHEEGWFLMQTRWMLWFEEANNLSLLRMIPRKWLEDGKEIILDGVKSYFGAISLKVKSEIQTGKITAVFSCNPQTAPDSIEIRLPHPEHRTPVSCSSGNYDPATEAVTLSLTDGKAQTVLTF